MNKNEYKHNFKNHAALNVFQGHIVICFCDAERSSARNLGSMMMSMMMSMSLGGGRNFLLRM